MKTFRIIWELSNVLQEEMSGGVIYDTIERTYKVKSKILLLGGLLSVPPAEGDFIKFHTHCRLPGIFRKDFYPPSAADITMLYFENIHTEVLNEALLLAPEGIYMYQITYEGMIEITELMNHALENKEALNSYFLWITEKITSIIQLALKHKHRKRYYIRQMKKIGIIVKFQNYSSS